MTAALVRSLVLLVTLGWAGLAGWAQAAPDRAPVQTVARVDGVQTPQRPLPDIPTLMRDVETRERTAEIIQRDYLYRSVQTEQELNSQGGIKKTTTREYDVFWLEGVPVRQLMKKDGRALSAEEQKKERERIDKEVAKVKARRGKADREGKETDPRGHEEITASRFLELGSFTNPRRVELNGRDTIAVDYAGNPQAKTRNRAENVVRDLVGTVWVDEQDRALVKVEGHFVNPFKIGAGLVASIQKGTSFGMEQRKVNSEVWLPARIEGHGAARLLLFFSFNGSVSAIQSDYRKFKATSTVLPGISMPASQ